MQGYNCIMVYNQEGNKLLFCKRTKNPYNGLYNLVGGKIELGENGYDAAYRELEEETGIDLNKIELSHMMDFTYYNQNCYVEVYVGRLNEKVKLYAEKHPLVWLSLDENFFDDSKFAGEGNIGHMVKQVEIYGVGNSQYTKGEEHLMEIKKIAIVGMGALGVMYGDFLAKKLGKENIEFVANENRIENYNKYGLSCNGKQCGFTLVDEKETGNPADLIIFAVKANHLDSAIETLRNKVSKDTIIMSVLNGISSEEIIGKTYGMDKIIYTVVQGMDVIKEKNKVKYTQFGHVCIGISEATEEKKMKLQAVVDLFDKVEMPYILEKDIIRRLWSKFMLNVGVNQVVMIYEGTYRTVQEPGEARELFKAAMKEVMTLAQKENVNVTIEDFDSYVELIDNMNPDGMPSMRQDGLAKRKSEVELFAGTVIKLANKHNIDVPVNRKIYETVLKMESSY